MKIEKVSNYIVQWLKSYAENAGAQGFVVGISGGIDSAVTSTLAAKTGLPTLCIEMPIHQPIQIIVPGVVSSAMWPAFSQFNWFNQ